MYKGRYGEVLIDPHLYKPCCQRKPKLHQQQEEDGEMKEEEAELATGKDTVSMLAHFEPKQEDVEEEEQLGHEAR